MKIKHALACIVILAGIATPALAEPTLLGDKSDVRFVSVKNAAVAEVHHFKTLRGAIDDGKVEVIIPLMGVETMIPIRNERMQEMLFETGLYPRATLSGNVDMDTVMALEDGEYTTLDLNLVLNLHNNSKSLHTTVRVARLGDELHVSTLQPIIINAADYDLAAGIERLREVAGLESIATQVPVMATLVFSR